MRIPTSFPLFGKTVTVAIVPVSEWTYGDDSVGLWNPATNAISIREDQVGPAREQTFLHELIHAILDGLSHRLARNEVFVDQFASLMHQALRGARYARKRISVISSCQIPK
jgi:Zn-dependent peptidase ImmA (M78 family)